MATISCIVCVYNEGDRLRDILSAVDGHPALKEVIVVDDGSTDGVDALLQAYPNVRVIAYGANRGKTYAMSRGIAAATGELLMFLDADLAGLGRPEIDRLAAPIAAGRAQVSISLRRNSLPLYRLIGLDFVSGERVIPAWLVRDQVALMEALPRWGGEAFINQRIIEAGLRIEVVDWPRVNNIRKHRKIGRVRGALADGQMVGDALRVLSPFGLVGQNVALLNLVLRRPQASAGRWWMVRRS
jgi:glycosyltransferase involved in cell wall biosynthesis